MMLLGGQDKAVTPGDTWPVRGRGNHETTLLLQWNEAVYFNLFKLYIKQLKQKAANHKKTTIWGMVLQPLFHIFADVSRSKCTG